MSELKANPPSAFRYTKTGKIDRRDPEVAKRNLLKAREAKRLKPSSTVETIVEEHEAAENEDVSDDDDLQYRLLLANALRKEMAKVHKGTTSTNTNTNKKTPKAPVSEKVVETPAPVVPRAKRQRKPKVVVVVPTPPSKTEVKTEAVTPVVTPVVTKTPIDAARSWEESMKGRGPRFG